MSEQQQSDSRWFGDCSTGQAATERAASEVGTPVSVIPLNSEQPVTTVGHFTEDWSISPVSVVGSVNEPIPVEVTGERRYLGAVQTNRMRGANSPNIVPASDTEFINRLGNVSDTEMVEIGYRRLVRVRTALRTAIEHSKGAGDGQRLVMDRQKACGDMESLTDIALGCSQIPIAIEHTNAELEVHCGDDLLAVACEQVGLLPQQGLAPSRGGKQQNTKNGSHTSPHVGADPPRAHSSWGARSAQRNGPLFRVGEAPQLQRPTSYHGGRLVSSISKVAALLLALVPCVAWGQHIERVPKPSQLNPSVCDVKDYGAVSGDGADDTAAFNRALAAAAGVKPVLAIGDYHIGALTFPAVNHNALQGGGTLTLSATLTVPSNTSITGISGNVGPQYGYGPHWSISTSSGTAIEFTGSQNQRMAHCVVQNNSATLPAVKMTSGALFKLDHCSILNNGAGPALEVHGTFWVELNESDFGSVTGAAAVLFSDDDLTPNSYVGYVNAKNVIINGGSFKFDIPAAMYAVFLRFENITSENAIGDMFEITGAGTLRDLQLINCVVADPAATSYLIDVQAGATVEDLRISLGDDTDVIRPTSTGIVCLDLAPMAQTNFTPVKDIAPAWLPEYRHAPQPGIEDIRWVGNPYAGGHSTLPGNALTVSQLPASWTLTGTAAITSSVLGPFGRKEAATATGNVAEVQFHTGDAPSIAVGDWFIAGFWRKNTSDSTLGWSAYINYPDGIVNADTTSAFFQSADMSSADTGWHFHTLPVKVTTVGADPTPQIIFAASNYAGLADTSLCYPFLIHIPAGTVSDADVRRFCRSMRSISTPAFTGDLATLTNQKMRLGGGAGLISTDAQPSSGTYYKGDKSINNTPDVGEAQDWTTTVSGTQGTLSGVTGSITNGTASLVVNSATNLEVNQFITIAGVTGVKQIIRINGTTVTISSNADATVAGAAVAYSPATFVAGPTVGASQLK
jgi:hypothetical protein